MPTGKKPSNLNAAAFSSAHVSAYQSAGLTPRSGRPHSDEPHEKNDEHASIHDIQREPLLASSSSSHFPNKLSSRRDYAEEEDPHPILTQLRKLPLALGLLVAAILVVLAILSYKQPDLLLKVVLESDPEQDVMSVPTSEKLSEEGSLQQPTSKPTDEEMDEEVSIPSENFIDYSNYTSFPLTPLEYAAECWIAFKGNGLQPGYWKPPISGHLDVPHVKPSSNNFCSSTITYQLDGYVGLMAHLALLSQVAALANDQNRTLFIDDRYWNRGFWTDHFQDVHHTQPGPEPGCLPPPPEELVACPRTARHWVVNSRTAKHHFGSSFEDQYHNAYAMEVERLHPIYDFAATGLSKAIVPNKLNQELIRTARKELGHNMYIGVHVRRGDRVAKGRAFRGKHIPLENFADAITQTWNKMSNVTGGDMVSIPTIWIATDSSPAVDSLASLLGEDFRVFSLDRSNPAELQALAPISEYNQSTWNDLSIDQRLTETRGMVVDFAMLSGAWWSPEQEPPPKAVVCTFTSNVCTLSAVPLTWTAAFADGMWMEIDLAGTIEPIWRAFELF